MQKELGVLADSGEGRLRCLRTGLEEPQIAPAPIASGRAHLGPPCTDCSLDKEHLS